MTDHKSLPEKLGPFIRKEKIESGWGWTLFQAEQALDNGKNRTIRLRIFYNQPEGGQLHKRLLEARDIFSKHAHLHLQRIFEVEHFVLENKHSVLAVAEEKIEAWTPPRESDYRTLMGQLLGAVKHMASVKLPGAGLSSKNLGRTAKGNAVICNLSAVWEQHWSGRSRAGDAEYYRTLPPEMAEQPAEFSAPQWVWSAGVILLDALASMNGGSDATISDELDVFDSAVSEHLSHNHADYFEKKMMGLPGDIRDILQKCLAPKVSDRYASLQALRGAVDYPIKTTHRGERYVMPSSYRVGEVTAPSKKTAAQAYTVGFLAFAAAVVAILLFVLLRPVEDDTAPLTSPKVDERIDPEWFALHQKLEDADMKLQEPQQTVQKKLDIPDEGEAIPEEQDAPLPEPFTEPMPPTLSVLNSTGQDILLVSGEGGISNRIAAGKSLDFTWPLPENKGSVKAVGEKPWMFSTYEVNFDQTNRLDWVIDTLIRHKAQIVLRGDADFPNLEITYTREGKDEFLPMPDDLKLTPGTYQLHLHRPDHLPMKMKVKFPYAPGMFALTIPDAQRWVETSNLKKLLDWTARSLTEPEQVLKEMDVAETLTFESEEHRQKLLDLKRALDLNSTYEVVTLNLLNTEDIPLPVTLVLSTEQESTKTLIPGEAMTLPPGEYVAQFIRPDYLPFPTLIVVSGKTPHIELSIPAETKWSKTQPLLDLIALEKAYNEKKDARTIIFLMQGLKNVEFESPENQKRFTHLRRQYYDGIMD